MAEIPMQQTRTPSSSQNTQCEILRHSEFEVLTTCLHDLQQKLSFLEAENKQLIKQNTDLKAQVEKLDQLNKDLDEHILNQSNS